MEIYLDNKYLSKAILGSFVYSYIINFWNLD